MIQHKSFCLETTDQLVLIAKKRTDYEAFETSLLNSIPQPDTA
jgi:hypothetical protein